MTLYAILPVSVMIFAGKMVASWVRLRAEELDRFALRSAIIDRRYKHMFYHKEHNKLSYSQFTRI